MENQIENPTILQKVYTKSYDVVENTLELLASWYIGQTILKFVDRGLWVVEKSAEWSLPNPSTPTDMPRNSNGTSEKPVPLVRPLPWLLFIPLLSALRVIRALLNLAAMLVGMDSIKTTQVLRFVQNRRRKVRALKFRGLKRMNEQRPEKENLEDAVGWKIRFFNTLKSTVCVGYTHNDTSEKIIAHISDTEIATCSADENKETTNCEKINLEEIQSKNFLEKLNEMAACPSDEDPDFTLGDLQSDEESVADEDEEVDEEDEEPLMAKPILKRPSSHSSNTKEIIKEENEDSDTSEPSLHSDIKSTEEKDASAKSVKNNSGTSITINAESKSISGMPDVNVDSVTSDEFYSPLSSMCPSPELSKHVPGNHISNNNNIDLKEQSDIKICTQHLIETETRGQDIISKC